MISVDEKTIKKSELERKGKNNEIHPNGGQRSSFTFLMLQIKLALALR
jgi:hypothetical protein